MGQNLPDESGRAAQGRTYPAGRRQWVVAGIHLCDAEQYAWLNDAIVVGTGEVRWSQNPQTGEPTGTVQIDSPDLVLDVAELIWEPIPE